MLTLEWHSLFIRFYVQNFICFKAERHSTTSVLWTWSERRMRDKIGAKRYELLLPAVLYVKLVNFFILCETKHSDLINFPQVVFIFFPSSEIGGKG